MAAGLLAALPWLNPFVPGVSAPVTQWLVSMGCTLLLWVVSGLPRTPRPLLACAAVLPAAAALLHGLVQPQFVMLVGACVLVLLAASTAASGRMTHALQAALLAAACTSAIVGLLQYFGASEFLAPWIGAAVPGTAFGNLRQPNQYATLCAAGAALVLFSPFRPRVAVARGLMVLLAAGAAAAVSRTSILEALALLVLAAAWPGQRRERLVLCLVAAVSFVVATVALPLALERLAGVATGRTLWVRLVADTGCESRRVLWSNVLHLVSQKPLGGWGWGELDYAHYATLYAGPRFCTILDNAHNLPLHLAVELGVPVAVAACLGLGLWVLRLRPWREQDALRQSAWAILLVLLVHSMLEYPLWYGPFQMLAGLCVGWLLASSLPVSTTPTATWARATVAGLLAFATTYAAWDYARVTQVYLAPEHRLAAWEDDPLAHARRSWLFADPAKFAALTLAQATVQDAVWMYPLARDVLHYSPEPRVIERLVESAALLGNEEQARFHADRYRAAFPADYERWREAAGTRPR